MAFWNAPLDDPDHRDHAIATALAMLAALDEVNAARRAADPAAPALRVGIGINTGSCVVGNMGSEQRFDYSALGDAVNLAARLEGQTRLFDVDIIVGEETARASRDGFALLELDRVAVKGKTEPVRISAVLGDQSVAVDPAFLDLAAEHDAMLAAYRQRQWTEAAARAKRCATLGVAPAALYGLYQRRFAALQANPSRGEDAPVGASPVEP